MKITTFNPMILTKKPEEAIALFEALGFERHHHKSDETENEEQGLAFSTVRMKDANGFYVDVCTANTDRIERENGFRESKIAPVNYTPTSKYAFFISPSGFIIDLIKHIKKDDK